MATIATTLLAGAAAAPAATSLQPTTLQTLSPATDGSSPSGVVVAGGVGYISANDADHGTELFRVDGTAIPRLVKDIVPGRGGSSPQALAAVGNELYFTAADDTHGRELWRTDGTAAGTELVKDILPGSASSGIDRPVASGGRLYFTANDGTGHGQELWTSDGTDAGTQEVKDIRPGAGSSYPDDLTPYDGGVAFEAGDGTDEELWVSDGTASGTTKVDVAAGSASSDPFNITAIGTELYFAADDGLGHGNVELYKSDGTTASLVKDLDGSAQTGSYPTTIVAVGTTLFVSVDDGELFVSDGTAAGTTLVNSGTPGSVDNLTAFDGRLLFTGDDGDGPELWSTDGTPGGTTMVKDINNAPGAGSYPGSLTVVGSRLDFLADDGDGEGLWTTDGTDAGTTAIGAADMNPSDLGAIGSLLYFTADDAIHGREPAISDGTPAGTVVHDLNTTGVAGVSSAVKLGDLRLFEAGLYPDRHVFVTDGTAAGSHALATRASIDSIRVMGGKAYFFGRDGNGTDGLYATDGTDAGTQLLHTVQFYDFPDLTVAGDHLYFTVQDGSNDEEPWVSDGTPAGTHQLADLNPNTNGRSHATGFTALGSKVVFAAFNGSSTNPWGEYVSDGTQAGTVALAPAANVAAALGAAATLGAKTYFFANRNLWATDGTPSGTAEVTSALRVPGNGQVDLIAAGGKLYFNADDGTGPRLFAYDGTGSPVALTGAASGGNNKADNMVAFGGGVLFTDPATAELGISDGTPAGTHGLGATVADTGDTSTFLVDGAKAWFTGTDGDHGDELWSTDGTSAGTALAADLVAGPSSSHAMPVATSGDDLLVGADQPGSGTVLTRLHAVTTDDGGGDQSGGQTTTTTPVTATTTTTAPAPAPARPAPAVKGRAKARGLSLTASASAGRRLPLRIAVSGRLKPAAGVSAKAACTGTVTVAARRGDVVIAGVRVKLRADCSYRATLTKTTMKHLAAHGGRLTVVARFSGNAALLPARSATRTSHYGA